MRRMLFSGSLLAMAMAMVPSAEGRVVYVNKHAPGAVHDGTSWATAFLTISAGLTVTSRDPTDVWVAAGIYSERITVPRGYRLYAGFAGNETVLSQRTPHYLETELNGSDTGTVVACNGLDTLLDGFTITHGEIGVHIAQKGTTALIGNWIVANTAGVVVNDATATLTRNQLSDNRQSGFYLHNQGIATLTDNTISGNSWSGVNVFSTGRVTLIHNEIVRNQQAGVVLDGPEAAMTGNTVSDNLDSGVRIGLGGEALLKDNMVVRNTIGVEIVGMGTLAGNTVADNRYAGVYVGIDAQAGLTNNIVAFNTFTGVDFHAVGYTPAPFNNNVFGNPESNYGNLPTSSGNGNISVDPLFADHANGDFHLRTGSPCIDAGLDSAVAVGETDVDGDPRLAGPHVDIGADEFSAATETPFTLPDVVKALRIAGGASAATSSDMIRLNLEPETALDLRDAAYLARKVAGLDANP